MSSANTAEGPTLWDGATPEADAYFRNTIGSYQCDCCGTEFSIDSVLFSTRDTTDGVDCPVCGGDDHLNFTPLVEGEPDHNASDAASGVER